MVSSVHRRRMLTVAIVLGQLQLAKVKNIRKMNSTKWKTASTCRKAMDREES